MYVDDLIIKSNDDLVISEVVKQLDTTFSKKDLGSLSYFCGVEVLYNNRGIILSQHKYIVDILSRHNMFDSKLVSTPLAIGSSLSAHDGGPSCIAK